MIRFPAGANLIAYVAVLGFVPFAFAVFSQFRTHVAALIVILAGELFLPMRAGFDLPFLPFIGRETLPYIAAGLCLATRRPSILRRARLGTGIEAFGLLSAVGLLGTTVTNLDPVQFGSRLLQPMDVLEAVTGSMTLILTYALPVFIGRAVFRSGAALRDALVAVALGGLVYIPVILIELKISPQLHYLTYGYQSPLWAIDVRYGGFRPFGWMTEGLALAIYMVGAIGGAAGLRKARMSAVPFRSIPGANLISRYAAPLLVVALVLCKSIASAIFGVTEWVLITLFRPRMQTRVALALAAVLLVYPVLRSVNAIPTTEIISWLGEIDADRAQSLNARFENEDGMLAHARDRLVFGWGGYGRNWVIDKETGDNLTIPDGQWVIAISAYGLVGFLCVFLIYVVSISSTWYRLDRIRDPQIRTLVAACALIVAFRAIDLIPNGLFSFYSLFMAGVLQGSVNGTLASERVARAIKLRASAVGSSEPDPVPAGPQH